MPLGIQCELALGIMCESALGIMCESALGIRFELALWIWFESALAIRCELALGIRCELALGIRSELEIEDMVRSVQSVKKIFKVKNCFLVAAEFIISENSLEFSQISGHIICPVFSGSWNDYRKRQYPDY